MTTLLVDAHNLAYRAWFNPDAREDADAAAALFIRSIKEDAEHVTACRTIAAVESGPTFRFRLFSGYKAGRKERSPELKAFIHRLPALARQAGVEVWHAPDHEADDVMATLATQLDGEVYISTTDKDLYACVNERVKILLPQRTGGARIVIDLDGVTATFGVQPQLVALHKALVGDTSDGIPGVRGLGPIKVKPLLQRFSSLDALYAAQASLEPSIQTLLLRTPQADVKLYHRLTTLITEAPLERLWGDGTEVESVQQGPSDSETTPVWGLDWRVFLTQRMREPTSDQAVLAFLNRHPAPPELSVASWSENWRRDTDHLQLDQPNSFGWCLKVLADPTCPPELLEELSQFDDLRLNRMIAWHPRCPGALLTSFLTSQDAAAQRGAVHAPGRRDRMWPGLQGLTEEECRRRMLKMAGRESDVPFYLACHPSTPEAVLLSLAKYGDVAVRLALASRTSAPEALFETLIDSEPFRAVRQRVAQNPLTAMMSPHVFMGLFADEDEVASAFADNIAIDESIEDSLGDMLAQPSPWVLPQHPGLAWPKQVRVGFPSWHLSKETTLEARLTLARDPACPIPLLVQLAEDESPAVRSEVAIHAASPPEVRQRLKRDQHWHVRRMAQRDFTTLVGSEAELQRLPWYLGFLAASHPSCPPRALAVLAQAEDWRVRVAAARHSACPSMALQNLAERQDCWATRTAASSHAHTPPEMVRQLAEDPLAKVRRWAATHPACSYDVLAALASDADAEVRRGVAGRTDLPESLLRVLAEDNMERVRLAVAENAATSPSLLNALMRDKSFMVRVAVASHRNSPLGVLYALADDESIEVRKAVSRHHLCPIEILRALTLDVEPRVRSNVAVHVNCPPDSLEVLSQDQNSDVRSSVASNSLATAEHLRILSEDSSKYVRRALSLNKKCPLGVLERLALDEDPDVRIGVAANTEALDWIESQLAPGEHPNLDFLARIASDKKFYVRHALLEQPQHRWPQSLPGLVRKDGKVNRFHWNRSGPISMAAAELIIDLAPTSTLEQMASNPHLSSSLLELLMSRLSPSVALALMRNPNVPSSLAKELDAEASLHMAMEYARLAGAPSEDWLKLPLEFTDLFWLLVRTPEAGHPLLEAAVQAQDERVRAAAASNLSLPPQWLALLGQDADKEVRLAVAGNPLTPPGTLALLLETSLRAGDEGVSVAAACHPGLPETAMLSLIQMETPLPVVIALVGNDALPNHLQLFLACDMRWEVRRELELHPFLTSEARARLSAF